MEEDAGDEDEKNLFGENNDNKEKIIECPEAIEGIIPSTPDCKFAIHCSRGAKTFGPIPCRNNGVFDVRTQNCVQPTPDFVCQWDLFQPKGGEDNVDSASAADPPRQTQVPTLAPITSPSQSTTLVPEKEVSARTSFVDVGDVDDELGAPSDVPAKQSFWKTSLNPSTGTVFTLQVVAIAALAGVLIIVLAIAMFSLGRRIKKNSKGRTGGAQTIIRPVLIQNLPSIPSSESDTDDEGGGFVAELFKTLTSMDDDSTIQTSTIQTRPSMKSTRSGNSMLKSSLKPPPARANQTLQTIQVARQMSKEVTEKELKPEIGRASCRER